jgi:hypothetical protein
LIHGIADDSTEIVRILACPRDFIGGLFVHYRGKTSKYCHSRCPPDLHKIPRQWYGYLAAERYHQPDRVWYPIVLEVTENAEMEMRGVAARGQVWVFSRGPRVDHKHAPVVAVLTEQLDTSILPPAFNVLPVLHRRYRSDEIDLSVRNPMPSKVTMPVSQGPVPEVLRGLADGAQVSAEDMEAWRAKLAATGFHTNTASNGRRSTVKYR